MALAGVDICACWRCACCGYWICAFLASLVLDLGREAR